MNFLYKGMKIDVGNHKNHIFSGDFLMRLLITLTLSILSSMHLAAATAQLPETDTQEYLNPKSIMLNLDNDKDGRLNYLEAMAETEIADRFLQLDLDKNGLLSINELTAPKKMNASQLKILLTFASLQSI